MQMPSVETTRIDRKRNVIYKLLAYRALTNDEALFLIRSYLAKCRRQPKPKTTVTITTIIGHDQ